jgi:hypothetical protein
LVTGPIGIQAKDDLDCAASGCGTKSAVWILCVMTVLRAARTVPTSVSVKPQVVK